jgi:GR25 family glycosyltransferase involved in LPS biosynthesis
MVTWNNIKIADRGFLINLEERTDRLQESLLEFDKNSIQGVERFNAIKITEDSDQGWVIRGCTHSHMELLKRQVENGWEKMVIFEDDFILDVCDNRELSLSNEMIEKIYVADFDLLFLGACLLEPAEAVSENLIKPNKFVQTTSYLTSLKFAEYVVNNFNYLDKELVVYGEQIDSYYSVLAVKDHWLMDNRTKGIEEIKNHDLKIYFHTPILFNQRESYSNILNRYTNYFNMNRARNLANIPQKKLIL